MLRLTYLVIDPGGLFELLEEVDAEVDGLLLLLLLLFILQSVADRAAEAYVLFTARFLLLLELLFWLWSRVVTALGGAGGNVKGADFACGFW